MNQLMSLQITGGKEIDMSSNCGILRVALATGRGHLIADDAKVRLWKAGSYRILSEQYWKVQD